MLNRKNISAKVPALFNGTLGALCTGVVEIGIFHGTLGALGDASSGTLGALGRDFRGVFYSLLLYDK